MKSSERMKAAFGAGKPDCLPVQPIMMTFASRLCGYKYGDYCRDYRLMAESQLRVAETFDLDVLTVCSDPVREAADCGAPISWFEDQPPSHEPAEVLLKDKLDLIKLKQPDPLGEGRMHDRVKAAAYLKDKSGGDIPVLGWIEGPLAEASDLRGINTIMLDVLDDPDWVRDLFEFICEMEIAFARAQAPYSDVIGMGDAACSLVNEEIYSEIVIPYEKRIVDAIHEMGLPVRLHICGRTTHLFGAMATLGVEMVEIDSLASLESARKEFGSDVAILGNVDPVSVMQNGTPESVWKAFEECYRIVGWPFIVGPGCEVPPGTPHENVRAMVDFARSVKP